MQATALALLGGEAFIKLANTRGIHPSQFIRYGQRSGRVSVKRSGFPKPHVLVFHEHEVQFTSPTGEQSSIRFNGKTPRITGSGWDPQTLLLGYGATRLLPRPGHEATPLEEGEFCRVDNLFDPFAPLIDAEAWLLALDKERCC